MTEQRRTQETTKKKSDKQAINIWKWAFLALFAVLLGIFLFIGSRIFVPAKEVVPTPVEEVTTASFDINLNKEKANQIIKHYLNNYFANKTVQYQFNLDKEAVLVGNFKLLGHDTQFFLYFEPTVLQNGNVRLEAKNISIGNLNLPINYLMTYIAKEYPVPEWVTIDAKNKSILLNLHQLALPDGIQLKAKKIDLDGDDIRFEVGIPTSKENKA